MATTASPDDPYYVRIVPPMERLRPYITAYNLTCFNLPGPMSDYLFPEWTNLRLLYRGEAFMGPDENSAKRSAIAVAHGPTSRSTWVQVQKARVFAVGITPIGWVRFFDKPAVDFADSYPPLADLLGPESAALEAAIAEADDLDKQAAIADEWFSNLLERRRPSSLLDEVNRLHNLLNDPDIMTVEQICDAMAFSTARLTRLSRKAFGFAPKLLLRRQRFLRMLGTLHFRPYEEWRDFLDPLYVDQSHFIRDFQRFMNMSPSQYLALPRPIQQPAVAQRAEIFGQPTQGLHLDRRNHEWP